MRSHGERFDATPLGHMEGLPATGNASDVPLSYKPRRRCATPGCNMVLSPRNRAGLYGDFCASCAAGLAVIREQLEAAPVHRAKPLGRRPAALTRYLAEVDERITSELVA